MITTDIRVEDFKKIVKTNSTAKARREFFEYNPEDSFNKSFEKFYYYARYYYSDLFAGPGADWCEKHKEMVVNYFRQQKGELPKANYIILGGRGLAKSNITEIFITYCICYKMEKYILYVTHNTNCFDMVKFVLNKLSTGKLNMDFPEIVDKEEEIDKKKQKKKQDMRKTGFDTNTKIRLEGKTVKQSSRGKRHEGGKRYTRVFFDDFESSTTLIGIETERIKHVIDETVSAADPVNSRISYLCNYISDTGNVHKMIHDPDFYVLNIPLYFETSTGDKEIVWKERFTITEEEAREKNEELRKKKNTLGEYILGKTENRFVSVEKMREEFKGNFDAEYLNKPVTQDTRYFNLELISNEYISGGVEREGEWILKEEPSNRYEYVFGVDVASGAGADHSAVSVLKYDPLTGKTYNIGYYANNRVTTLDFAMDIVRKGKEYNNAFLVIENNAVGVGTLDYVFKNYDRNRIYKNEEKKVPYYVVENSTDYGLPVYKNKQALYDSLKIGLEEQKLLIKCRTVLDEIGKFQYAHLDAKGARFGKPISGHFDILSSLVFAWKGVERIVEVGSEKTNKHENDKMWEEFHGGIYY